MKILLCIPFLFLIAFNSLSLDVKQILTKMSEHYRSSNTFSIDVSYSLFKTFSSTDIYESYSGFIYNEGGSFYQKVGSAETVSTMDYFVKVNHDEQIMLLALPSNQSALSASVEDLISLSSETKVITSSNHYKVQLRFDNRVNVEYSMVELIINKESFLLEKTIFFYSVAIDFSENFNQQDLSRPRLEVSYNSYNKGKVRNTDYFDYSRYLKTINGQLKLAEKFSAYELLDIRNN